MHCTHRSSSDNSSMPQSGTWQSWSTGLGRQCKSRKAAESARSCQQNHRQAGSSRWMWLTGFDLQLVLRSGRCVAVVTVVTAGAGGLGVYWQSAMAAKQRGVGRCGRRLLDRSAAPVYLHSIARPRHGVSAVEGPEFTPLFVRQKRHSRAVLAGTVVGGSWQVVPRQYSEGSQLIHAPFL